MALLFCDGFDHYKTADILKKWSALYTGDDGPDVGPSYAAPPGGQGLHFTNANGGRGIVKILGANYATLIVGTWWQAPGGLANDRIITLNDDASEQISVRGSNGKLTITRNGTALATSTNSISAGVWYHLELKVTIHNTTGVYELRVNGTSTNWIPQATGQNTRNTSNNYVNRVALNNNNSNSSMFDDFYVLDTSGSVANDFVGPQKIITLYPNAEGAHTDFVGSYASNFANVNETLADGDVTFNQSSTPGDKDSFVFDDIPDGTVTGIQHVLQARQDIGTQRTLRPIQRSGGTDYAGASVNLTASHIFVMDPKSTNPVDSAAFEPADVNGAEFGYELV